MFIGVSRHSEWWIFHSCGCWLAGAHLYNQWPKSRPTAASHETKTTFTSRYFSFLHGAQVTSARSFARLGNFSSAILDLFKGLPNAAAICVRRQGERRGFILYVMHGRTALFVFYWACMCGSTYMDRSSDSLFFFLLPCNRGFYFSGDVRDKNYKRPTSKSIKVHTHSINIRAWKWYVIKYLTATQTRRNLWRFEQNSPCFFQLYLFD